MQVPFVDLSWQHAHIKDALSARFENIFAKSAYILGPAVEQFEKNFAAYLGVAHAVGVGSGTDALVLALRALGIGPGDEVVIVDTSFIASASAVVQVGARPVFADIDQKTRNARRAQLEAVMTEKTKALMPVHLYGAAADMDAALALAKERNLFVIEDACQAHGATYQGKKLGTFGDAAAFSFYPGKNLGAYGDGGVVVTNDAALAAAVKKLRNHGGVAKYEHEIIGYNSRLDSLQAAVLEEKLAHLDEWNRLRARVAASYDAAFKELPVGLLMPLPESESVHHLYMIDVESTKRMAFMEVMKERGIGVGIHYPAPLHLLPAFSSLGYRRGDLPAAEAFCESIVSLPVYPGMTNEQTEYVIDGVREFFKK